MRWRLWRRRLTISAPRMAIRSAVPWPVRWFAAALVLGLSAVLALWAFEFGRDMAGLDPLGIKAVAELRDENNRLRHELSTVGAVANTADSLLTTERAAQAQLAQRIRQLEAENQSLRSDLAFFDQLLQPNRSAEIGVRALQARQTSPVAVTWRVLLVQAAKNPTPWTGEMEIVLRGVFKGQPWSVTEAGGRRPFTLTQSLKLDGVIAVPQGVVVKAIVVRVVSGTLVKSSLTVQVGR